MLRGDVSPAAAACGTAVEVVSTTLPRSLPKEAQVTENQRVSFRAPSPRVRPRPGVVLALLVALLIAGWGATRAGGAATGPTVAADRCPRFLAQSLAREHLVTGRGAPVIVIGDSYAAGLGLTRPASSWPAQLSGRVHVFGFSGSGFSAGASRCQQVSYAERAPRALRTGPGLVVIEGGLNDWDQSDTALRSGLRVLLRRLAGRQVVVVGPPLAPARARGAARVDQVLSAECERAGTPYVTMVGLRLPYLADGLHLTPRGHRLFGAHVATALAGTIDGGHAAARH